MIQAIERLGRPRFIHTDSGGQFISQEFRDFLQQQDIKHYLGNAFRDHNHNQVIERFNRTLKHLLRAQQLFDLDEIPQDFKWTKRIKQIQLVQLIGQTILEYNNTPHSHLGGYTPRDAERALILEPRDTRGVPEIARDGTLEAIQIRLHKKASFRTVDAQEFDHQVRWAARAQTRVPTIEEGRLLPLAGGRLLPLAGGRLLPLAGGIARKQIEHFKRVCEGKEGNQKVFTSQGGEKTLSGSVLNTGINPIFRRSL